MKKVGLYFGSFNPVHVGHLAIASFMVQNSDLDEIWMVVSPQNPHKKKASLLEDYHRMALMKIALEDDLKIKASDIEFGLPVPSYTSKTLAHLEEAYPDYSFALIMGEDNIRTLHKWYNYEHILNNYKIYVYPRPLVSDEIEAYQSQDKGRDEVVNHANVAWVKGVPVMHISSSFIRAAIKEGKDVRYLLTSEVFKYIDEMNFYR